MGFKAKNDFFDFSMYVKFQYRYALNEECQIFLKNVTDSVMSRDTLVKSGTELWRSQIGSNIMQDDEELNFSVYPLSKTRMTPCREFASDGRASPKGIVALYLSFTRKTAMSEQRPWLGADISCARFVTTRDLKIIDCSKHAGSNLYGLDAVFPEDVQEAVWAAIDYGFSTPVNSAESSTDYFPTQILSELFKSLGFDGVRYKSSLCNGFNLALFNVDMAKMVDCQLFGTSSIQYEFSEASNIFPEKGIG